MRKGTIFTGVSAHFSAAHTGRDGRLHGHTWKVKAWVPFTGQDAELLKAYLFHIVSRLDHTELMGADGLGEEIAARIGNELPDCVSVTLSREAEGIYCTWRIV